MESGKQVVAEALAEERVPMLRELQLHVHDISTAVAGLHPVWRALGQGACPRLQSLRLEAVAPEAVVELAAATEARQGRCNRLTELNIDFDRTSDEDGEWGAASVLAALDSLLRSLSPSLETVQLRDIHVSALPRALAALLEPGCRVLQSLTLMPDRRDAPLCGDVLVRALAGGAAPGLRQLWLEWVKCSDSEQPWQELSEAMQVEGGCLSRLQSLKLEGVFRTFRQVEIFTRALGSGHGCPELEKLCLRGLGRYVPAGAFLAPAFRPPRGLPLLKHLELRGLRLDDANLLLEALRDRPHARRNLEELVLSDGPVTGLGGLGAAMHEGGPFAALKRLDMPGTPFASEGQEEAVLGIIAALASGAGQHLETINWPGVATMEPNNLYLRALAVDGACPRLRCLAPMRVPYPYDETTRLDMRALGAVLAGRAACSATLTEVDVQDFNLSSAELGGLAACLEADTAVRLEVLMLSVGGTCIRGLMDVLGALRGRAGSRLKRLRIEMPDCEEEPEGEEVADYLADMIEAGSLPEVTSFPPTLRGALSWTKDFQDHLLQAMRSRADALW